ncbi:hypothetical protein BDV25DRAFT_170639 [Aspergillus avenaceus]|uniref:RNase III domain-containing protein n=1 Tax=Aspergillus avenaceus TaxID=36643 RepID=A0A5N6U1G2_ASPAV|nr:hypothetical protein BDV25DRAFT_170639 [Aspergillus avenaceus]
MASDAQVQAVEFIIGHTFSSTDYIRQALTAAGAEGESHDGNRALAQIGAYWIDTVLMIVLMRIGVSKEHKARLRNEFTARDHFTFAAKRTGISECIKYSYRSGKDSPTVLRNTINAIVAAVLLDTGSISTTLTVLRNGDDTNDGRYSDPIFPLDLLGDAQNFTDVVYGRPEDVLSTVPIPTNLNLDLTQIPGALEIASQTSGSMGSIMDASTNIHSSTTGLLNSTHCPNTLPDSDIWNPNMAVELPTASCPSTGISTEERKEKRRKCTGTTSSVKNDLRFREFIEQEREFCKGQRLPPPEATHFTPYVREIVSKMENRSIEPLLELVKTIASPPAIIALRDVILDARTHDTLESFRLQDTMSKANRVSLIEKLENKVNTVQLLKWYHILELFQQCGGPSSRSTTYFINSTSSSFEEGHNKSFGNPRNNDDARVTQAMMKDICPGLEPGMDNYRTQLTKFKRWRKLAKRLHSLTEKYGRGILGLMLGKISACHSVLTISDNFDPTFSEFIPLLDTSQGQNLCLFSDAAWKILEPLLFGRLKEKEPFALEKVDPQAILKQPKWSPGLLNLIR